MTANGRDGRQPVRVHHANGDVTPYEAPHSAAEPKAASAPPPAEADGGGRTFETAGGGPAAAAVVAVAASAAPAFVRRGVPVGFMVFCGAIVALVSMGIRNTLPLWQSPMLEDLGWTSLQFSIALATQNLLWGVFSPVFGGLADRYGSEKVLVAGAILQAGGLWLMSKATDPALFFVSAGVLIGVAQSAAGMGIVLGAVGRMLPERQRTMAFGLITSASSAGMIVLSPIGRALLEMTSWSEAFVWLAVFSLPVVVLAFFVRSNQSDGAGQSTAQIAQLTIREALGEAARHRGYVLLVIGFFVCGFHVTFIGVHFPKYLNDIGLGWQLGATSLMIIGIFNVASCLGVGVLVAAVSKRKVLSLIYIGRSVAILGFIMAPVSEWSVYIFSAAMGVLWLSTVPPTQGIVAQVFGTQYMTMLFGFVFLSHQIGSFLGVTLGAQAYDMFGDYRPVWLMSIALGILAAICHIFIDEKPLARLRPAAQPAE